MGQAKRRGTFEQRQEFVIARNEMLAKKLQDEYDKEPAKLMRNYAYAKKYGVQAFAMALGLHLGPR